MLPSFVEASYNAAAPLSLAVARCKGAVQYPVRDLELEGSTEGLDAEHVAAEHFALFGPPMLWQDAFRSSECPLGVPWGRDRHTISSVRASNARLIFALRRLKWRLLNWGFACIALPERSWAWEVPLTLRLCGLAGVFMTNPFCKADKSRVGETTHAGFVLLHNCPAIHSALHCDATSKPELFDGNGSLSEIGVSITYLRDFEIVYAQAMVHALKELDERSLPMVPSLQTSWLTSELAKATKRLAEVDMSAEASTLLGQLLSSMQPGREEQHLRRLLKFADHRGGEVRLSLLDESGTLALMPYPCFAWKWKTTQSYRWQHEQHINVLEFVALFNYLRSLSNKRHLQHLRLFHVLDSKVVCGVCSKGRSSARRLNRCCRRLLPFILGMDWYLVLLSTVSRWQSTDQASRVFDHGEL